MKVVVLGSGLVGRPMAADLAKDPSFTVSIADRSRESLDKVPSALPITTIQADLSKDEELSKVLAPADIVLNAVPGFMGFHTLKKIISTGKNVVDIAFFPEDCFQLDALAKERGVVAVTDCGVAPGMSNLLAGHVDHLLDSTESVLIYVGGLPVVRNWPYEYKASFSPIDVIEEYTRPARYVENGALVVRPALSDPELITFPLVGTLEAFNSDGLRSLAVTLKAPHMKEKTLRYPGHIDKIMLLRESGFFSEKAIDVSGVKVRPLDVATRLLFPMWELKDHDEDFTVMKVIVEGRQGHSRLRYTYDLLDRHDPTTNVHSMARVTGYTATSALRMVARGLFTRRGISPPEFIGQQPECVAFMLNDLRERGVIYHERIEIIPT